MEEGKYLRFAELSPKKKTRVWAVAAKNRDVPLGIVQWFGRWRCYCFFPFENLVFEQTCMRDISDFIERKTIEHREGRKNNGEERTVCI